MQASASCGLMATLSVSVYQDWPLSQALDVATLLYRLQIEVFLKSILDDSYKASALLHQHLRATNPHPPPAPPLLRLLDPGTKGGAAHWDAAHSGHRRSRKFSSLCLTASFFTLRSLMWPQLTDWLVTDWLTDSLTNCQILSRLETQSKKAADDETISRSCFGTMIKFTTNNECNVATLVRLSRSDRPITEVVLG